LTEVNTGHAGKGSATLFKADSKAPVIKEAEATVADNEGKDHANGPSSGNAEGQERSVKEAQQVMREQPTMKNTFLWQNLKYVVSVSGER